MISMLVALTTLRIALLLRQILFEVYRMADHHMNHIMTTPHYLRSSTSPLINNLPHLISFTALLITLTDHLINYDFF